MDPFGRTALHYSAWPGDVGSAHDLLKAGAAMCGQTRDDCYDSDFPCNTGSTPLHVAALRDRRDWAALLLGAYVRACQAGEWHGRDPWQVEDAYGRRDAAACVCGGALRLHGKARGRSGAHRAPLPPGGSRRPAVRVVRGQPLPPSCMVAARRGAARRPAIVAAPADR